MLGRRVINGIMRAQKDARFRKQLTDPSPEDEIRLRERYSAEGLAVLQSIKWEEANPEIIDSIRLRTTLWGSLSIAPGTDGSTTIIDTYFVVELVPGTDTATFESSWAIPFADAVNASPLYLTAVLVMKRVLQPLHYVFILEFPQDTSAGEFRDRFWPSYLAQNPLTAYSSTTPTLMLHELDDEMLSPTQPFVDSPIFISQEWTNVTNASTFPDYTWQRATAMTNANGGGTNGFVAGITTHLQGNATGAYSVMYVVDSIDRWAKILASKEVTTFDSGNPESAQAAAPPAPVALQQVYALING